MDFSWTEEQLKYKRAVIEFAQEELNKGLIEHLSRADQNEIADPVKARRGELAAVRA